MHEMSYLEMTDLFSSRTREDWADLAHKSLKGKPLDKVINAHVDDQLMVRAFHSKQDLPDPGEPLPSQRKDRNWIIAQSLDLLREDSLSIAKEELAGGSHGLRVQGLSDAGKSRSSAFLAMAGEKACWLCFDEPGRSDMLAKSLLKHDLTGLSGIAGLDVLGDAMAGKRNPDDVRAHAEILADLGQQIAAKSSLTSYLINGHLAYDMGASHVFEVTLCLATARLMMDVQLDRGVTADQAATSICFSVACDSDQFLTMAKGRALQYGIRSIFEAYGAGHVVPMVIMRSAERCLYPIEPHVNQLRLTAMAAGAVFGGASVTTLLPHDHALSDSDGFSRRMARNIQTILMQESHLGQVIDPAAGSYAIETLTRDMAEKAWQEFQMIDVAGGLDPFMASGELTRRLRDMVSSRQSRVDQGKTLLTGINSYPLAMADMVVSSRPDAETSLSPKRPSATFEVLRATAARREQPVRIGIVPLGALKDYSARLNFLQNALAAAGLEVTVSEENTDLSVFDSVFLCASDADYAALALDKWLEIRDHLTGPCWMAGGAEDVVQSLQDEGIVRTVRATDSLAEWLGELMKGASS